MQATRDSNEERYLVDKHGVNSQHCPLKTLPDTRQHAMGAAYDRLSLAIGRLSFQRCNVLSK